jgi:hypothetical protein
MKRNPILKKSGKPSNYFWNEGEQADASRHTVYKQTEEGVRRMKGVTFDAAANRINKTDA